MNNIFEHQIIIFLNVSQKTKLIKVTVVITIPISIIKTNIKILQHFNKTVQKLSKNVGETKQKKFDGTGDIFVQEKVNH